MQVFTKVHKDSLPKTKNDVLTDLSSKTGLNESVIAPLFESYIAMFDGDVDRTTDALYKYFLGNDFNFDEDTFEQDFLKVLKSMDNTIKSEKPYEDIEYCNNYDVSDSVVEKLGRDNRKNIEKSSTPILSFLKKYFSSSNVVKLLESIIALFQIREVKKERYRNGDYYDRNFKSYNLLESTSGFGYDLYSKMVKLYEAEIPIASDNKMKLENSPFSADMIRSDLSMYNGLKGYLNELYKYCDTAQLRDVYQRIVNYIDYNTDYLKNLDTVNSVDESNYSQFLNDLLINPNFNAIYQSVDYIKTITPDLQTLLFDLVIVIDEYVKKSQPALKYVNIKKQNNYRLYTRTLLSLIASSKFSSKLIHKDFGNTKGEIECCQCPDAISYQLSQIMTNEIEYNRVCERCIMIIKNMQNEFNLKIRKSINNYVTASLEILTSLRRVFDKYNNFVNIIN